MNSKMTTNSQLSTSEPKKMKDTTKTKQTTRTGTESHVQRNGPHMEGFHWGGGREGWGERYREEV